MAKNNQKIKCSVDSCKYNDCNCNMCTLKEIKIACDCKFAEEKDDTICDSYLCKDEN